MKMVAKEAIEMSQDITPPLPPLSCSLYDSSLSSHCSSCFLPLSTTPTPPSSSSSSSSFLRYCSNGGCSTSDIPLHFSSAEHHLLLLLHSHPSLWPHPDSSDIRLSLRLLHLFLPLSPPPPRLLGLLTNRHKLISNSENSSRVRVGARAMAIARAMRDGREFEFDGGDCDLEEAVMCLVVTNAVEISFNGEGPLGVGFYDGRFSWINHSCSPNSCFRFVAAFERKEVLEGSSSMRILACGDDEDEMENAGACRTCDLSKGCEVYGPRLIVRSIKGIQRGEEVTVTYTDLLQPTILRRSELLPKYQFACDCRRCSAVPQTYVDLVLQDKFLKFCTSTHLNNHIGFH